MITEKLIQEIETFVQNQYHQDSERLLHIYNVKKVAIALGKQYEVDIPSVIVASYLHDATKEYSEEENIKLCGNLYHEGLPKGCVHAYAARNLAETRFGIADEDILNAIQYHCSGRKEMSRLEKVIFVSDFIEEGRDFVDEALRNLAKRNLDKALLEIMLKTKSYLLKNNQEYSSMTEEAIQYYKRELEELND